MLAIRNTVFCFAIFSFVIFANSLSSSGQEHFVSTGSPDESHSHSASAPDVVPAWTLPTWDGREMSSHDFRGKPHVLLLHLGGDCLHCVEQVKAFDAAAESFGEKGIEIVSIAARPQAKVAETVLRSREEFSIDWFLCDPSGELFRQLRAFDNYNEVPMHGTYLVDEFGAIRWARTGVHPFLEADRLLEESSGLLNASTVAPTQEQQEEEAPKIFLDKSPRVIAYQLGRLENNKLLMVERKTDDKKYVPVYQAILTRAGMSPSQRQEALQALATLNETDSASVLLESIQGIKQKTSRDTETVDELGQMLLKMSGEDLQKIKAQLKESLESENVSVSSTAFAALLCAGDGEELWEQAASNADRAIAGLSAIKRIPSRKLRDQQREMVLRFLADDRSESERRSAIQAAASIQPDEQGDLFYAVAPFVQQDEFRDAAVTTLLKMKFENPKPETCQSTAAFLVDLAENTDPENRTSDTFTDAMQLCDRMLGRIPVDQARAFRARLNEVTVRVVKIHTIEDEMRFDVPFFAVQAGRPVQVVLVNDDIMAHNLLITRPGDLKLIANLGLEAGTKNGFQGKQYVPDHESMLFATHMVPSETVEALTFDAPTEPGEYPYVCTFPDHWQRMYGVMVVVNDLDTWMQNPVKPKDPTGSARSFVNDWTVEELAPELEIGLQGRSEAIGRKIFVEATCATCHKIGEEGGAVGPALDEVYSRLEGDDVAVLRELLEPSHRIAEEYQMHKILTIDGVVSGIIQSRTDEKIELIENAEAKEPVVVLVEDIEDMAPSSSSLMPKALMNNFTKDEIFEMLSYIKESQKEVSQEK